MPQEQVDPTALALKRSIFKAEGGDYNNTSGDNNTSAGAGQWNNGKIPLKKGEIPANFKSAAAQFGLDPNDFSETAQDHVGYLQVKHDLDSGLTQSQIAAKWNSGLTHGWENHKGTTTIDGKTISYDTPAYVAKVQKYYQEQVSNPQTSTYNPNPYSKPTGAGMFDVTDSAPNSETQTSDESLGGKLVGRVNDASQAITDLTSGKQNIVSTTLQTVGAGAGAIGDVVNKGLEFIPGIKALEGVIGDGVGKFATTDIGKKVIGSLQQFGKDHPELSKDSGAGFNIITAIPILRGLGVVKNIVLDGASMALKNVAEKQATDGLTKIVSSTITGRKALVNSPEAIKTLVGARALPEISSEGKYVTKDAFEQLGQSISDIEEKELQPALEKANTSQIASRISLEQYKKEAMADAVDELKDTGPIEKYFDRLKAKYGDYPTLKQLNEAKRTVANNISEAGFNSPTYSTDKIVRSALQKSVEDGAKALNLPDVNAINAKMARLIKAQNILKHIDGKSVKTGLVGDMVRGAAAAGGETLGNMTGVPLVGSYMAYKGAGAVSKRLSGIGLGVLSRTTPGTIKQSVGASAKKLGGLVGGTLLQQGNR